jgi:hypothetical protein
MNQTDLNKYFSTHWKTNLDQYTHSGWSLVSKIKSDEAVLDVGCGLNPFKRLLPRLTGIDPAFVEADYQTTIEDFVTDEKFDVAFCLGSINFGTEDRVVNQIRCVIDLLKPKSRIYWRCNPGLWDHGNTECANIEFFPWTVEKHIFFADQFGFKLMEVIPDSNNRLYALWAR